tara:strand:+ start:277 stop:462 length:186 start_codon:yes stop_codon:yes gene_type:complete
MEVKNMAYWLRKNKVASPLKHGYHTDKQDGPQGRHYHGAKTEGDLEKNPKVDKEGNVLGNV